MFSLFWSRQGWIIVLCTVLTSVWLLAGCGDGGGGGGGSSGAVLDSSANPVQDPVQDPAADPDVDPFPNPNSAGGIPISGYPNWQERALLVLTNMVRMDPRGYRDQYTDFNNILLEGNYPVAGPLYWNYNLNQSARYHAEDMAINNCFQHDSCDGTAWSTRIRFFYPEAAAIWENIAAGTTDPQDTLNLLLCEGPTPCVPDLGGDDGHRLNIMDLDSHELGTGYSPNISARYAHYWVQDFASNVPAEQPPIVSGSHMMIQSDLVFFLNYYTSSGLAPQRVRLTMDGAGYEMVLDLGEASAGTYAAALTVPSGCRSYYFEAIDAEGETWRYPGSGELQTFGVGGCTKDYTP